MKKIFLALENLHPVRNVSDRTQLLAFLFNKCAEAVASKPSMVHFVVGSVHKRCMYLCMLFLKTLQPSRYASALEQQCCVTYFGKELSCLILRYKESSVLCVSWHIQQSYSPSFLRPAI